MTARPEDPEQLVLRARDVRFDWSRLPMHWVPGEPQVGHTLNVLHLVLPEGERWFVEVFKQAVPLIRDDRLREDVLGFIGQEAMHAEAHAGAAEHLDSRGLDTRPFLDQMAWLFRRLLGDRELTGRAREEWLVERLAMVAAIEHYTAFLGQWMLDAHALDHADPMMLDLLRWHAAEEVEHRSVAFDLFRHLDGRYFRRVRSMLAVTPVLAWMFVRGTRYLMRHDPELRGRTKASWRTYFRAAKRGQLPTGRSLLREIRPYFRRSYHPSETGSTDQAVAYLASSPAARAADAPR
jgi:predicted metal-dependent hydrolase